MTTRRPDLSRVAFVFTCDPCAAEHFPHAELPRVAAVLGPRDWIGHLRCAVIHATHTARLTTSGFEVADPDPDEKDGIELWCPHSKWDAALDEWTTP